MAFHTDLNTFDYIVLGIVLVSGILALTRGFVREVLSLLSLTGAFFAAVHYYPRYEPFMHRTFGIKEHAMLAMASGVAVFFGSLVLFTLISFVIARMIVRGRALTMIDRSLGFGFGILRGALVVCIIYMAAVAVLWHGLDQPQPPATQQATTPTATAPGTTQQAQAQEQDRDRPPEWLLKAKTRPALAYGAHILQSFIPEKALEGTSVSYFEEKTKVQHEIDDKALVILSTPEPAAKPVAAPAYDDKSRAGMNQLIDQQRASP